MQLDGRMGAHVGSVVTYVDWMDGGNLAIRNLATGESRRLTDTADNGAGDNGGHYAVDSRISPDGERVLYSWARSSPAGETVELRVLAYSRSASRESPGKDILLVAVDGSRETTLVQHAAHDELVAWSRGGGHLLLTSDRSGQPGLWAQRVQDGKPVGEPHLVFTNVDVGAGLGIAADGTLHYAAKVTRRRMKIAELDTTTGRLLRPPANVVDRFVGGNSRGVFSPDGTSLAYVTERQGWTRRAIVIRSLESGEEKEIPDDLRAAYGLTWWPDGRRLTVQGQDERGRYGLFDVDVSTGRAELFTGTPGAFGAAQAGPRGWPDHPC